MLRQGSMFYYFFYRNMLGKNKRQFHKSNKGISVKGETTKLGGIRTRFALFIFCIVTNKQRTYAVQRTWK